MSKKGETDQSKSFPPPSDSPFTMSDLSAVVPAVEGLSAAEREAIQTRLQATLDSLNKPSPYFESLSPKIKLRVEALQEIQKDHDELESKFYEEKASLEAKYQKLYDPLYAKRSDIVNGVTDPTAVKSSGDDKESDATPADDGVKGVPDFWLMALKANEVTQEQITERDEGALKFLTDIKWSGLPDSKGFKLDFFFTENPYFKNSVLTKTYHMIDDEEPILEKAEGTEIQWNSGKNLTQKILKKKPKKGAKNTKPITKTEDCESFFNFFNPPQVPADEEEIEEDEAEILQEQMEADYEIGSILKEKVIPHAVSWFTGEAVDDELDYDDEDEEEGDDDDDDDDIDEEDDDDEDEEEEKPSKQTKSKGQVRK